MMKLATLFVAAAAVVNAETTDDYDEMNLNIRLLASHNATLPAVKDALDATSEDVVKMTMTTTISATGATVDSLKTASEDKVCKDASKTILDEGFCATINNFCANCAVESLAAAAGRRKRALQSEDFDWTESTLIASANKDSFSTVLAGASFTTSLVSAITAAASTAGVSGLTVDGVTTPVVAEAAKPTPAPTTSAPAPAPAAAAPAPAEEKSSNASLLKANVALVAIAAAIFA